jgi:hypothetical protein
MKQILVTKSIAYAAKAGGGTITGINEINLLDTGAIAIFTENNFMLTAANVAANSPDVKKFYIAVGNQTPASKTYISQLIPRMLLDYIKKAYVAPVKLVKFIGSDGTIGAFNFPTLVAGQSAFIRITDTTPGLRTTGTVYDTEIKRYEYIVQTGDTATIVANKLIAMINADPDSIAVAAAVGATTGIQLTAKNFGTTFSISLDGVMVNSTKEEPESTLPGSSVAIKYGDGTSDQILALEQLYSPERGNDNQVHLTDYYYSLRNNSNVVGGATYDTYTFAWNGRITISLGEQHTYRFETVLAMPAAATQQANFETIMADLVGNFENSETGV